MRVDKATGQELHSAPACALSPLPLIGVVAIALFAIILATAVWAWAHYGTAIFFETIAAGIAACF